MWISLFFFPTGELIIKHLPTKPFIHPSNKFLLKSNMCKLDLVIKFEGTKTIWTKTMSPSPPAFKLSQHQSLSCMDICVRCMWCRLWTPFKPPVLTDFPWHASGREGGEVLSDYCIVEEDVQVPYLGLLTAEVGAPADWWGSSSSPHGLHWGGLITAWRGWKSRLPTWPFLEHPSG